MSNSCKLFVLVGILGGIGLVSFAAEQKSFSYDNYAAILKDYVDDTGMVNYKQLKARREKLDAFVTAIASLDTGTYEKWNDKEKIAFWLNVYNALTLKAIIDNYPIKSSFFKSRIYPKNSIRQISGVWDKITFNVMGDNYTLEHIEHKILRKEFNEPRIHMAMVCAAIGCPPLRNEPYTGGKLDKQLKEQSQQFLSSDEKLRINRKESKVYVSPILKWFADDFVDKYGLENSIAGHNRKRSAVLNFIATYLKKTNRDYILSGKFKIKYLKYDWTLNES